MESDQEKKYSKCNCNDDKIYSKNMSKFSKT